MDPTTTYVLGAIVLVVLLCLPLVVLWRNVRRTRAARRAQEAQLDAEIAAARRSRPLEAGECLRPLEPDTPWPRRSVPRPGAWPAPPAATAAPAGPTYAAYAPAPAPAVRNTDDSEGWGALGAANAMGMFSTPVVPPLVERDEQPAARFAVRTESASSLTVDAPAPAPAPAEDGGSKWGSTDYGRTEYGGSSFGDSGGSSSDSGGGGGDGGGE